jgi:hypothetical protein
MKEVPQSPNECPICQRVEKTLLGDKGLSERLSRSEVDALINKVQSSILNKEIEKDERGIKMSDEKYVISKASFEDFYETQDNLVAIIEKMVDRIEKQDQVIMKFGGALSELIAKAMDPAMMMQEAPLMEEEEEVEGDIGAIEGDEAAVEEDEGALDADLGALDEDEEIVEEEVGAEEAGLPADGLGEEKDLMGMIGKAEQTAFEAGWKAASAEMKKQNGIPVNITEFPSNGNRPVPTADKVAAGQVQKSISDVDLAKMTTAQLNRMLKEQGY